MRRHCAGAGLSILDCHATEWLVNPQTGEMTHPRRKPWRATCGYLYYDERVAGRRRKGLVHRAIWESTHGRIERGLVLNHINGDKADNRINNLELVTHRQNNAHAKATGLNNARGERAGNAALTEQQVREIHSSTGTQDEVGARYGVTRGAVKEIWAGRTWRHLGLPIRKTRKHPRGQGGALTNDMVVAARQRARAGASIGEIAADFGVNPSTLAKAISGYSWGHLPGAVHG